MSFFSVITDPDFFTPFGDLVFSAGMATYSLWKTSKDEDLAKSTVNAKLARKLFRLHTAKKRSFAIYSALWFIFSSGYKSYGYFF